MAETTEIEPRNRPSKLVVMAPYRYDIDPLPPLGYIRVLVLQPGPNDDNECPLAGSLKLLAIDDADSEPFKFEAISYVWGSREKSHVILVDGQLLRITASLREALLQTRLPDRSRRLWADAICIDQSDDIEKGHQVFSMGRIYKKSKRTLICLGAQRPDNAQHAASLVDAVNLTIQNIQQEPDFSGEPGSFPLPAEDDTILTDSRWWLGWNVMLDHPWFRRGWVIQEASLGADACVLWASVQVEWTAILRVDYWLDSRGFFAIQSHDGERPLFLAPHHATSFALRHPKEARSFDKDLHHTIWASTLSTLFNAGVLGLSDPRDRIYAFMALDTSDGVLAGLQLEPDYRRSFKKTYHEFAVNYIRMTGDLDILTYTTKDKASLASPSMAEAIPSWVPRWDLGLPWRIPIRTEMGDDPNIFQFSAKKSILQVRGLILGSVKYAAACEPFCQYDQRSRALQNVISLWKEVMETSNMNEGPYNGRQAVAFFDVLCPLRSVGTGEEWLTWRQEFVRHLESYMPGPERNTAIWVSERDELRTEQQHSLEILANQIRLWGPRRFVILGRGYYGVAPLITQEGDLFALVYGNKTLSILRPAEDDPDAYKIIGPVYSESKTVKYPDRSNMMGEEGCRDWEEWDLTPRDINLC
ncbi:hypothetical protein DHEL01_v210379 [Diaporthe helianthi]|uniref:Heterokaryon incompatibility domain-containing protein n=1 Tax=Diaporthe helianthi TaxID=158607 RepID=A0A2P5HLW5_DIAHE|nr:hypothetical protein DHEL01_v210379 [Diaporthe helianthi]